MTDQAGARPNAQVLSFRGEGHRSVVRLRWTEQAAALAIWALVFGGHLLFGAARREIALGYASLQCLTLAGVLIGCRWARLELPRAGFLAKPVIAFGAVFVVALWSMTPIVPGGPHPMWAYVPGLSAAAVDRAGVILELLRLSGLGCLFLTAWIAGADDDRARWLLRVFTICAAAFAVWAFVSHLVDPGILFGAIALPYAYDRLSAAFLSANTAAACFGATLLVAVAAATDWLRSAGGLRPAIAGAGLLRGAPSLIAAAFSAACLVLTASRGGLLATAIALVAFFLWEALARRWKLFGVGGAVLGGVAALLLILVLIGPAPMLERLLIIGHDVSSRQQITAAHWGAFLSAPWMGYGLGSFEAINRVVTTNINYPELWDIHAAHDVYLQWLEEAGVLGAMPMFLTIGGLLALMVLGARRRSRMTTWIRGLAAASLVLLIHGASDFALQVPSMSAFFACILGLGCGLATPRPVAAR